MTLINKKIETELQHIESELSTDIKHCLATPNGGYFSTTLLVLSMIDYLSALWSGNPDAGGKDVKGFIDEYFEENYKRYSGLLYIVYRHGIAHERMPKLIRLGKRGKTITLYFSTQPSNLHLQLVNVKLSTGKKQLALYLSIFSLYNDISLALEKYKKDLYSRGNRFRKLRKNFQTTLNEMRRFKSEHELLNNGRYKKYLSKTDFDNLKKQLTKLVEISGP